MNRYSLVRLNRTSFRHRCVQFAVFVTAIGAFLSIGIGRVEAAAAPQAAAPVECTTEPSITGGGLTVVSRNIIASVEDAQTIVASDTTHTHKFELQIGALVTPASDDGQQLQITSGAPAIATASLLELDSAGTIVCAESLLLITFPVASATPTISPNADGTTTVSDRLEADPKVASMSYMVDSAEKSITLNAIVGPTTGYRLQLIGQSTAPNLNTFDMSIRAIGRDGNDAFGSGSVPIAIPADAIGSCGGFPAFASPKAGIDQIGLGPVTLTPTAVHFSCAGFSAGFDIQASIASFPVAPTLKMSAKWASGQPLIINGLSTAIATPIQIDGTTFTIQDLQYANGVWTLSANIGFKKLAAGLSSLATFSVAKDGTLQLLSPIELQVGKVGVQVKSLTCSTFCSGQLGLEMPGFNSAQDQPLTFAFASGPAVISISNLPLSGTISGVVFSLNASSLKISSDSVTIAASGTIDVPSISKGITVTGFTLQSSGSSLQISANLATPATISSADMSLFSLSKVIGAIKYDSTKSATQPTTVITFTGDGAININDLDKVLTLNGSIPGITATLAFGPNANTSFTIPTTGVSFTGTFFGRSIDGGCSDQSKPFLTTISTGVYDFCVGIHLMADSTASDVADLDMNVSGAAQRLTVNNASISYGSASLTTTQRTVTSQTPAPAPLDPTTTTSTTTTVAPAGNAPKPLQIRLGGKVLAITKIALRYEKGQNGGKALTTIGAPDWAHQCSDDVSGSISFDVQSVMNSSATVAPVEMTASSGLGKTALNKSCYWFDADGTAGLQIAPNVSAVVYHAEFATYQDSTKQLHPAVHLEARGDLAYQNYTVSFKSINYDDPGTGDKPTSSMKVDTPNTVLKNVPAIASFLGAVAARLLVK